MEEKDYITVYWSPAPFVVEESSWSQLYAEPTNLLSDLLSVRNTMNKAKVGQSMFGCPAFTSAMKNVVVVKNVVEGSINMERLVPNSNNYQYPMVFNDAAPLQVKVQREPSIMDYTNIVYNMSWLLFADEPLVARFTAPYFPASTPAEGVILSTGEFDIGSWYREFNLDYHVPPHVKELVFEEDQPLFYIDFKTDKKIILKRYTMTREIRNIADEFATSRERYGKFKALAERYSVSKKTMMPELLLHEIRKNVVE